MDTGDGRISVHAWYEGKGWEEYPFARVGSEDDRVFPFQLRLPGDRRVAGVSAELSNAREAYDYLSAAGGIFADVQLNTAILTDLDCDGKLFANEGASYPLAQAMEKLWLAKRCHPELSCNALILGDGGFGKSTMMYHQCGELLFKKHLAVYISLQAREEANNESIFDYVLRCLYKSTDYRARDKYVYSCPECGSMKRPEKTPPLITGGSWKSLNAPEVPGSINIPIFLMLDRSIKKKADLASENAFFYKSDA